jgi:magnesium-transporting ATPase (P-type)
MVSSIAIIFAVVFLVVGVTTVYKGKATQTFTFAVSILVAFVPEGLPSTVTLLCVHRILFYISPLKSVKAIYRRKAHGCSERSS